jgi:acyl-CoA synthetase (AMP-forming)/AMP-acid ligase II
VSPGLKAALLQLWTVPDDLPLLQYDGRWHSCGEVRGLSDDLHRALSEAGLGAGARVGVVLDNRPESVAVLLALLAHDRCLVTISPLQPPERLAADLQTAAPDAVVAAGARWEDGHLLVSAQALGLRGWAVDGSSVQRMCAGTGGAGRSGCPGSAVEMPTSGSTGAPKRIALTPTQLEASLAAALAHNRGSVAIRAPMTGPVAIVAMPIVHIGGLWALLQALVEQRRIALLPRFSVQAWTACVREHRPAVASLPPTALRGVLDAAGPLEDLASLRALNSGAAALDPDLADAFTARYGIPVLSVYGATELSGAVAGWSLRDHVTHWQDKRGSVGRAFPGVTLRVVDADGEPVPAGGLGTLEVLSAQAGALHQWVRTTDLARLDEDDFLWIAGRADDVIVRGGFKISPTVVRRALEQHPGVAEAAVIGLPDHRLGQLPVAAVEVAHGAQRPGPEELAALCRERLTAYEVPGRFLVLEALPRSAALKVDRAALLALFEQAR